MNVFLKLIFLYFTEMKYSIIILSCVIFVTGQVEVPQKIFTRDLPADVLRGECKFLIFTTTQRLFFRAKINPFYI